MSRIRKTQRPRFAHARRHSGVFPDDATGVRRVDGDRRTDSLITGTLSSVSDSSQEHLRHRSRLEEADACAYNESVEPVWILRHQRAGGTSLPHNIIGCAAASRLPSLAHACDESIIVMVFAMDLCDLCGLCGSNAMDGHSVGSLRVEAPEDGFGFEIDPEVGAHAPADVPGEGDELVGARPRRG